MSRAKVFKNKNQNKDKWITPPSLWKKLDDEFHFDLFDPAPIHWQEGDPNGLEIEWAATTFVNPPFSELGKWIYKADNEWRKGKTVVMITNVKTDLEAFHSIILKNRVEIRFLKGRVNFLNPTGKKSVNPFPSMVYIWRKEFAPLTVA